MQSVCNIKTIYLKEKDGYKKGDLGKTWFYDGKNPLPSTTKSKDASSFFNFILPANQEAIIRDQETGRLLMVILRNKIGLDVLEHINNIIIEMFEIRRPVWRSKEESSFDQGSLVAAGYLSTRQCEIFTNVFNLLKNLRETKYQYQHENKVVAANALLFNYAMGLFPTEVTDNIKNILEENQLPRLDGNKYGTVDKGFSISYMVKKLNYNIL